MEGRIDPLSSLHRLDASKLAFKAMEEELVLAYVDGALAGCLFAAPRGDALYPGKIAVRPGPQGRGIARRMPSPAAACARALGCHAPERPARNQLMASHPALAALGFQAHCIGTPPPFPRPTYRRDMVAVA